MATILDYEASFKTLTPEHQARIVDGLKALDEWEMFADEFKGVGLVQIRYATDHILEHGHAIGEALNHLED